MVTIEISGADIRALEINGRRITGWTSASLDPKIFVEGVISDPQALASAIRQLLSSSGIKDKNFIASVSSLYSLSRTVIAATVGEQPATEPAIIQAAETVMPLPGEELYFSWQPVGMVEGGQQVMVIGVPRDVMDSELRALRIAGITPHLLDLRTLALARAVNRENAIILNIDAASYDIVIITGGFPDVLRTTSWQPDALSDEDKAEQLILALELTASFSNSHHKEMPLSPSTPFFVTGHLSGNLKLIQIIEDSLPYHLEQMTPQFEYPEHMPVSQYAVNIGLAMKTAASSKVNFKLPFRRKEAARNIEQNTITVPDINLLPQTYKAWRPSAKQIYSTLAIMAVLGFLIPFYQVATDAIDATASTKQRYDAVNTVMQRRRLELAKRDPLQKAVAEYQTIIAMGGGFVEDIEAVRKIASDLKVTVHAINHTESSIIFVCEAPDYLVFRDFIHALENNGRFASPVIPPEGYPYIKGGNIQLTPKH